MEIKMVHVPIIDSANADRRIEFSYFNVDADVGYWKKQNIICLNNIKLNIFLEGEFSLLARDSSYRPTYGDICVIPPGDMHRGHIYKHTHVHYYQVDIGKAAFDHIDGGRELLCRIIKSSQEKQILFKPQEKDIPTLMQLCRRLREAIEVDNRPLAFALTIELVSFIAVQYDGCTKSAVFSLSKITRSIISHIEENYTENITLKTLSKKFSLSESYLSRIFKKETGAAIHEYLTDYRVLKATQLLQEHSVAEVCYMCGFSDSSHFIAVFKKRMGVTPMGYKKGNG